MRFGRARFDWTGAADSLLSVGLFVVTIATCGLFVPVSAHAVDVPLKENSLIIVGGDHNYPPYEFLDSEGDPAGYNVDLTRAIAEVMGMKVEIRLGPWSEMRRALENGSIDILQGMVYSPERSKTFEFSPPHSFIHESVFARKGTASVSSPADLAGQEVIVQHRGIAHDYLLEQPVGARLIPVDTHAAALRMLAAGKHDYALVGNLPGLYLGRELGLSNLVPVGKLFAGQQYAYAANKGNAELLAMFSEGLAILKNTGKQRQIYDKWLGPLEPNGIPWKRLIPLLGTVFSSLLLILGGIVVWNRSLKREVARRTAELQLHQQQLIQADKMASIGILAAGMAHEINNPNSVALLNLPIVLAAYQDCAGILEEHYRTHGDFCVAGLEYSRMREELPCLLSETLGGAERIKRIVEDLKDFARQGNTSLDQIIDLNQVVQAAVRLVENSLKKATSHLEQSFAEGLPGIRGNAQRIEQVVVNLIQNAGQALNHPEQAIRLATRQSPCKKFVIFEVCDEGQGIAPENLPHLKDPFFTTRRDSGGTGLGLSVSATIVQQHGGTLSFESTPGQGTTATLALPVHRKEQAL
jgi:polar amino acid transport system substrate-binding protein